MADLDAGSRWVRCAAGRCGPARPARRRDRRRARARAGRDGRGGWCRVTALAETVGVLRRFGPLVAVDDVHLRVDGGEVVGLLGANGAGKTTLIRILLGLLPPTGGHVRLFGLEPSRETRRRIGYVPQGLGLYDDLTPDENLAFAHAVFGGERGTLPQAIRPLAGVLVGRLSLGVQRRGAVAPAPAHRPQLLVLDEPTSGVDPLARARLWETIRETADDGAGGPGT